MDKRELRAKSIVERIVADLNKRFGFKLKITSGEVHKGPFSSSGYKYLRIQYPSHGNDDDFCSFCFDEVRHGLRQKQPTYVQLLNRLIKDNVMTYYNDDSYDIELNSLYGKTFDEIEIALDLANGASA